MAACELRPKMMTASQILEAYLRDLLRVRNSGSGVPETSHYIALGRLLDAAGATLKPKVRSIIISL